MDKLRTLDSKDLKLAINKCQESYKLAVDFLTNELPLSSKAYLPYNLQLTLLVIFFDVCPKPTIEQRDSLKRWFWITSLTSYFGSSNYTLMRQSVNNMKKYAETGYLEYITINKTVNYHNFLNSQFSFKSAASKTFALILASKKPRSLLDGNPINTIDTLAIINKNEYHHIFPKNFLSQIGVIKRKANLHTNVCMTSLSNNRSISDKAPSLYFQQIQQLLGDKTYDILETNFINREAFEMGLNNEYEKFIIIRQNLISDYIKTFVEQ